ncbi:uncharacterized protein E3U43_003823, partial [Larimichthys crocea]
MTYSRERQSKNLWERPELVALVHQTLNPPSQAKEKQAATLGRLKRPASFPAPVSVSKKTKKGHVQSLPPTPSALDTPSDTAQQRPAIRMQRMGKEAAPKRLAEAKSPPSQQLKKEERFSLRTRDRVGGPVTRSLQMANAAPSAEVKTEDPPIQEPKETQLYARLDESKLRYTRETCIRLTLLQAIGTHLPHAGGSRQTSCPLKLEDVMQGSCASGTAMEDTLTCSHATFSQVFGRQGQLMQATVQSLNSLNDQIAQFMVTRPCSLADEDEAFIPGERDTLRKSMTLMRHLLVDAQGKILKMMEDNKHLAQRIDGAIQSASQEVTNLRSELSATSRRLAELGASSPPALENHHQHNHHDDSLHYR